MNLLAFHSPVDIFTVKKPHFYLPPSTLHYNNVFKICIKKNSFLLPKQKNKRFKSVVVQGCLGQDTASSAEIDMVKNKDGIFAPKAKKVVLWDLDNKPPRGPPYNAATSLIKQFLLRYVTKCPVTFRDWFLSLDVPLIDMARNKNGIFAPKAKKVVLWDLDNKPPRGAPYNAATSLIEIARRFGEVVEISAYANRHAFNHLPQWVVQERRERRKMDILERKGVIAPSPETYVCSLCGRKCKTNLDLKKHFKQLHERERQKKVNRMRSLKGKKRQRFKERFLDGNHKYTEAERKLIMPKVGYGLAPELRRAGVYVKTVEDKPQAADWALKRQMQHSMTRGIDWLFLVSDDSDFSDMLKRAREADLGTVVVGDMDRALGRHADLWVPWVGVENGEISEDDLKPRRRQNLEREEEGSFSVSRFGGEGRVDGSLDGFVDELVRARSDFHDSEMYEYSERSESDDYEEVEDDDLLWDSEDEDVEDDDGYL